MFKVSCATPNCVHFGDEIELLQITELIVCGGCGNEITTVNGESTEVSNEVPEWLT